MYGGRYFLPTLYGEPSARRVHQHHRKVCPLQGRGTFSSGRQSMSKTPPGTGTNQKAHGILLMNPPGTQNDQNQTRPNQISFSQQNVAHSRPALEYILLKNPEIAPISEPPLHFLDIPRKYGYRTICYDEKPRAMILHKKSTRLTQVEVRRDIVVCNLHPIGTQVASIYVEDNGVIVPNMDTITATARSSKGFVLCGDVHAYSPR